MATLDEIRRIAEVEFASVVTDAEVMGVKLRIILTDTSYVDVWVSKKLENRFGFHWERGHLGHLNKEPPRNGRLFDSQWSSTWPPTACSPAAASAR